MKNTGDGRESEHYLSTGRAARMLKMSREAVRLWCIKGRIPGARQLTKDAKWQVPAAWVKAWLERTRPRKIETLVPG